MAQSCDKVGPSLPGYAASSPTRQLCVEQCVKEGRSSPQDIRPSEVLAIEDRARPDSSLLRTVADGLRTAATDPQTQAAVGSAVRNLFAADPPSNRTAAADDPADDPLLRPVPVRSPEPSLPPWPKRPGEAGFNAYAAQRMARDLAGRLNMTCARTGPFAYQEVVRYLTRRPSATTSAPAPRLAVIHRTGSGKTRTMIGILENFYDQRFPMIVIMPKKSVRDNFILQLFEYPNRFSDFVRSKLKIPNGRKFSDRELREGMDLLRTNYLRKDKRPDAPTAPLDVLEYTQAGGSKVRDFKSPAFNKSSHKNLKGISPKKWPPKDGNPYDNKVVLMDEFHHIVKPPYYGKRQLPQLRKWLSTARNSTVVGFTATPQTDPTNRAELMSVVKGPGCEECNDEGFVSYFDSTPDSIYPRIEPCALEGPERLGYVERVHMRDEQYRTYRKKSRGSRAASYCNSAFGKYNTRSKFRKLVTSEAAARELATKLWYIARHAIDSPKFTVILCHRDNGIEFLNAILLHIAEERYVRSGMGVDAAKARARQVIRLFRYGNAEEKKRTKKDVTVTFAPPGTPRIVLLDEKDFSEGVNMRRADRLFLVNPPATYDEYRQRVGRVLRACMWKEPKEHVVTVHVWVAVRRGAAQPTRDERLLEGLLRSEAMYRRDMMQAYGSVAVDRSFLGSLMPGGLTTCSAS